MKILLTIYFSFFLFHSSFEQKNDTTIIVGAVPVDFRFPGVAVRGAILVLPGWNFSRTDICTKSGFCTEALKNGYVLVLPEMLKSVYSSSLFPETRADWRCYPTLHWITDTLIPFCRNQFNIFNSGERNFLYGISTGARGVALVAENTDTLFIAGAALSGDYDQTDMPSDRLMTGYYGPYDQFKYRWEGQDNPSFHSERLKIPLFIAHGIKDAVVPYRQSSDFARKLIQENPGTGHALRLCDTCGHNWPFWNSQTETVLGFFKKAGKKHPDKGKYINK
jgi:S-formylglutathione hydrolase FrmB